MKDKMIPRRDFLGSAAAVAAFTVVPRHVLGGPGQMPPSEKLNIAGIGVGGQGARPEGAGEPEHRGPVRRGLATCGRHLQNATPTPRSTRTSARCWTRRTRTSTPWSWRRRTTCHAVASMAAIKRGKHVYCEKPLTHSVHEARMLAEAAREQDVATQMGNQGQASEETRLVCETIWDGAIGQVREVHVWTDRPLNGASTTCTGRRAWIGRPTPRPCPRR